MKPDGTRLVALGASNLTLGLHTAVATARATFGPDVEVMAALGYGRSYGADSAIAFRRLPGILSCDLWRDLERLPKRRTRALITDVGNDILYGFSADRILSWVEEAADRLLTHTSDLTITGLPLWSIGRLKPATFRFFRTLFFPPCRLSREAVVSVAEAVDAGLARLARERSARLVRPDPAWYALDPIHLRPRVWRSAWREILKGDSEAVPAAAFSPAEWAGLHLLPPDRRWLAGIERRHEQAGRRLSRGGIVRLY